MDAEPTLVVIGKAAVETSRGVLAPGEYRRLPLVEALELTHAEKVLLAEPHEQQMSDEQPVPAPVPRKRGRYRRRDLRAAR